MISQRQTNFIDPRRASEFLWNETEGLLFSVYFKKADGSMRSMICRRGVRKYLRGGDLPYDPKIKRVLPVFDVNIQDYRMVSLDRLVSFNIHGETFIVTG